MEWMREDTVISLIILAGLGVFVAGAFFGWVSRGWHDEDVKQGAFDGVQRGMK